MRIDGGHKVTMDFTDVEEYHYTPDRFVNSSPFLSAANETVYVGTDGVLCGFATASIPLKWK